MVAATWGAVAGAITTVGAEAAIAAGGSFNVVERPPQLAASFSFISQIDLVASGRFAGSTRGLRPPLQSAQDNLQTVL